MKLAGVAAKYIAKYFLGFLAVFICSVLVAAVAKGSIENYIVERAENGLREGMKTTGESIERMDLINQLIYGNKAFTTLVYSEETISREDVLQLRESNEALMKTAYISDYIPYMFILFRDNNLYLSSSQCSFDFDSYYGRFMKLDTGGEDVSTDAARIKEFFFESREEHRQFLSVASFDYMNDGRERHLDNPLIYLGKTRYSGYNPRYVFCFVMSVDYLEQNIVMPELTGKSFVYIEDMRSGDVLVSYGDVPEKAAECENRQMVASREEYLAIVDDSDDLGWRVVTGVPLSFVDEQMKPVNHLVLGYLLLGLLAVIGLTVYFGLERYWGFKRFRIQLDELKHQNQAILTENLIVKGIRTPKESGAFAELFGKEPEFYCVAVVQHSLQDSKALEPLMVFMLRFLKRKEISLLANVHSGVFDELFLIELSSRQDTDFSDLQRIFEEMAAGATEQFGATFHVGISSAGTGLVNINRCYEQARRIVQAQYAFENENIVETYDVSNNVEYENPMTLEFLNHLYNMLISGQRSGVEHEMKKLEGCYERMPYLYESHKEQIFYSLSNLFYTVMIHLNYKEGEKEIPSYTPELSCGKMVDDFRKCAEAVCGHIDQGKRSKNERLKESILQDLETLYGDPGLSAFVISQRAGISEKYLYQFLKEQTGETFASCLLRIRMEKAAELLRDTDYSNEQIAQMTGFGAVNTFYRNFKKIMGVTPNIYKKNL